MKNTRHFVIRFLPGDARWLPFLVFMAERCASRVAGIVSLEFWAGRKRYYHDMQVVLQRDPASGEFNELWLRQRAEEFGAVEVGVIEPGPVRLTIKVPEVGG